MEPPVVEAEDKEGAVITVILVCGRVLIEPERYEWDRGVQNSLIAGGVLITIYKPIYKYKMVEVMIFIERC